MHYELFGFVGRPGPGFESSYAPQENGKQPLPAKVSNWHVNDQSFGGVRMNVNSLNEPHQSKGSSIQRLSWGKWHKTAATKGRICTLTVSRRPLTEGYLKSKAKGKAQKAKCKNQIVTAATLSISLRVMYGLGLPCTVRIEWCPRCF
jgi:hypothetical protein